MSNRPAARVTRFADPGTGTTSLVTWAARPATPIAASLTTPLDRAKRALDVLADNCRSEVERYVVHQLYEPFWRLQSPVEQFSMREADLCICGLRDGVDALLSILPDDRPRWRRGVTKLDAAVGLMEKVLERLSDDPPASLRGGR